MEIDAVLYVVGGWRGKASRNQRIEKREATTNEGDEGFADNAVHMDSIIGMFDQRKAYADLFL